MKAFVATGGRSRRFGFQKCTYRLTSDKTMLDLVVGRIEDIFDDVIQVGSGFLPYLPVLEDLYPGTGPMGVILTVFERTEEDSFFLFGCDMPFLIPKVIERMIERHENTGLTVTVDLNDRIQTLHSIYSRKIYPTLKESFEMGERSVWKVLRSSNDVIVMDERDFEDITSWRTSFTNLNTLEEFQGCRELRC